MNETITAAVAADILARIPSGPGNEPDVLLLERDGHEAAPDNHSKMIDQMGGLVRSLGYPSADVEKTCRTMGLFAAACMSWDYGDYTDAVTRFAALGVTVHLGGVLLDDLVISGTGTPADWSRWTDAQIDVMLADIAHKAAALVQDIAWHQYCKLDGPSRPEDTRRLCLSALDDLRGLLNRDAGLEEQ